VPNRILGCSLSPSAQAKRPLLEPPRHPPCSHPALTLHLPYTSPAPFPAGAGSVAFALAFRSQDR